MIAVVARKQNGDGDRIDRVLEELSRAREGLSVQLEITTQVAREVRKAMADLELMSNEEKPHRNASNE